MKKVIGTLLSALIILSCFSGCSKTAAEAGGITVYDGDGNVIAQGSREDIQKSEYFAYLDIAVREAVGIIGKTEEIDDTEGEKKLFDGEYSIYTAFDKGAYESIVNAYSEYDGYFSVGCALTDWNGALIAAYSNGKAEDDTINYSTEKTAPYSAFKPLSVYLHTNETYASTS